MRRFIARQLATLALLAIVVGCEGPNLARAFANADGTCAFYGRSLKTEIKKDAESTTCSFTFKTETKK